MRASSSMTRRCGASSARGAAAISLIKTAPRASLLDHLCDLIPFGRIDHQPKEAFSNDTPFRTERRQRGADALRLRLCQTLVERPALCCRVEQPLSPIDGTGYLLDIAGVDQLLQHAP